MEWSHFMQLYVIQLYRRYTVKCPIWRVDSFDENILQCKHKAEFI